MITTGQPAGNGEDAVGLRLMERILYEVKRVIVGQDRLLERVLVALLGDGHLLVEGVPGLAKTLTVKTLAETLQGAFRRVQFTPDLLPADLVGTRVYDQKNGEFHTVLGPVFTNLLLADEINRAPAKVQSALLEVMQERQVTIGGETHRVPEPFLVMATQNPIETEGTYPLPEAQVDRFMMKVLVGYPDEAEEFVIVQRMTGEPPTAGVVATTDQVAALQRECPVRVHRPGPRAVRGAPGGGHPLSRALRHRPTFGASCSTAPAPGLRSTWSSAPGRSRTFGAAPGWCRRTWSTWCWTPCVTGSCSPTRPSPRG